jgi:GTP cyclohydrolase I
MDIRKVEEHIFFALQEGLGLDMTDPNLADTPKRIAKMYVEEFFKGKEKDFDSITTFPNEDNYQQIILLDRIHFVSVCSHHFLPFVGLAWLGYIPDKLLVGASKPSRIIAHYAARPQLQERLCHQVITRFEEAVKPRGTILVMRAVHGCMSHRGAKQIGGAGMITSAVSGVFEKDAKARAEAMDLINLSLKMGDL